jgi:hypothetical protein
VQQLRRYLASFTVTPIGAIVLVVLIAALGLFAFGPSDVQAPAMIVGLILLVGVVGGVPLGFNGRGWRGANLGRRHVGFRPIETQEINAAAADRQADGELWRKERERRTRDRRSG